MGMRRGAGTCRCDVTSPPHSDQSPTNPFWLNAVQTLASCNMLLILVPCVGALFNPHDLQMYLGFLLVLTPFSVPFAWIFWKLSAWPDARTTKSALAMAASWGLLGLISSLLLAWGTFRDRDSERTALNAAIISVVQVALILASIKTYLSMKRDRSDIRLLMPPLVVMLLILTGLMALVFRLGRVMY